MPRTASSYHFIAVPVAVKLATVGEAFGQKLCIAVPEGAAVVLTVNKASLLFTLEQLLVTTAV
ncbi:hypothetical protein D3C86_2098680 [compost metagenome]